MKNKITLVFILATMSFSGIIAQEHTDQELAKKAQNPLANMMSFPTQDNITFGNGEHDRTSNVLNVQPVLPFFKGHLIARTIIPLITRPMGETGNITAIGDINFTGFYAPSSKKGFTWGIGPNLVFPTGTRVSSSKFSIGPSLLILQTTKKLVFGFLVNNVWSVAGNSEVSDVNSFMAQYFFNLNFNKGWYISTAPIITGNWLAPKGQQWIVPFGAGVGKIVKMGTTPINLQVHGFYNAVKPDAVGAWSMRIQVQVLLPK